MDRASAQAEFRTSIHSIHSWLPISDQVVVRLLLLVQGAHEPLISAAGRS